MSANVATFLVDWNMVLELSTGSAVAAKALVQYANTMIKDTSQEPTSNQVLLVKSDLDIAACLILLVLGAAVALSLKPLCVINNILAVAGVLTMLALVVVGLLHTDADNWTQGAGFFPRGASGIMSSSGTCLFAFIGYSIIATACAESRRPYATVATATTVTFIVGLLSCFMVSVVITLLSPPALLSSRAPLVHLLLSVRPLHGMGYFVAAGAVGSLLSSAFAALFSLSRLINYMAKDGFLYSGMDRITSRGTPWTSALIGAVLSASMALALDLHALVTILGAGAGLAGATVASVILVHRYSVDQSPCEPFSRTTSVSDMNVLIDLEPGEGDAPRSLEGEAQGLGPRLYGSTCQRQMSVEYINESFRSSLMDLGTLEGQEPSRRTWHKVLMAMVVSSILAAVLAWHVTRGIPGVGGSKRWPEALAGLMIIVVMVGLAVVVVKQPRRHLQGMVDMVPCVPVMPLVTLWLHTQLLVALHAPAWIRILLWSVVGLAIRFLSLLLKVRSACKDGTVDGGSNEALNKEEDTALVQEL